MLYKVVARLLYAKVAIGGVGGGWDIYDILYLYLNALLCQIGQ